MCDPFGLKPSVTQIPILTVDNEGTLAVEVIDHDTEEGPQFDPELVDKSRGPSEKTDENKSYFDNNDVESKRTGLKIVETVKSGSKSLHDSFGNILIVFVFLKKFLFF